MASTSTLLYQWKSASGSRYRAVVKGSSTSSCRDTIIVEICRPDILGGDAWIEHRTWCPGDRTNFGTTDETRFLTALVDGMQAAITERDFAKKNLEASFARIDALVTERDQALAAVKNLYETSNA